MPNSVASVRRLIPVSAIHTTYSSIFSSVTVLLLSGAFLVGQVSAPDRDAEMERARTLVQRGSIPDAVVVLRGVATRYPNDAEVHLLLGSVLALVPSRSEAIHEVERAIELRPNYAPSYNTLGTLLARFAEYGLARQAFEKALELNPRLADAHQSLALVLAQMSEYQLAEDHVAQAIALSRGGPNAAYLHLLNGKILTAQDKNAPAANEFEAAIKIRPDYAEAYLQLAAAKSMLLDAEGSFQALRKAAQLAPRNAEAQYQLGKEYLTRGDSSQALAHLRIAYGLKPEDRGILYNYSRALRASGQGAKADAVARKLADMVQSSNRSSDNAAEIAKLTNEGVELEKRGEVGTAILRYRQALELDPLVNPVRRNLGLALCRTGRYDEGIAELREILRSDPNDAATTEALYIALDQAAAEKSKPAGASNK